MTGAPRVDLPYRLFGRARGVAPGIHRAAGAGLNGAFLRHASILEIPDARRIDLRASLTDPFGGLKVRRFENRARIDVFVVLDLSGSMAFGRADADDPVADLVAAIAHAALRRVATWADGWYGFFVDDVAQRVDTLRRLCRDVGRDASSLRLAVALREPTVDDVSALEALGIDEFVLVASPPEDADDATDWVAGLASHWGVR